MLHKTTFVYRKISYGDTISVSHTIIMQILLKTEKKRKEKGSEKVTASKRLPGYKPSKEEPAERQISSEQSYIVTNLFASAVQLF